MANKSIIDVDTTESITQEDLFYVNSNKSLKQIKNKNLKFDYDTHVINKPSINGIELCGGGGKSLNELGIGSSADIADLMQTKAGAIINSARGERIAVGDSAGAFFEGLKLYGKTEQVQTKGYQLFDASKIATKSAGGATVTNNGDGSFTISGSGNLSAECTTMYQLTHEETTRFLKAGTLKIASSNIRPKVFVGLYYDGRWSSSYGGSVSGTGELDITEELLQKSDLMMRFGFSDNIGTPIVPGTVKPMLYQDGDGTWEPFSDGKPSPSMEYKQDPESSGDGGTIGLEVFGKNLCPISSTSELNKGNVSGTIEISHMPLCEKYTLSCNVTKYRDDTRTNTRITIILRYSDGTNKEFRSSTDTDNSERDGVKRFKTVTATLDKHKKLIGITIRALDYSIYEGTLHAIAENIQMECGSEATDFVPYQDLRSTQFSTPNGLLGLPVDSGGNYTDSNGQQWICDEMDFKRGKYVQRVGKRVMDGSEHWWTASKQTYQIFGLGSEDNKGLPGLCDHFTVSKLNGYALGCETQTTKKIYLVTGHETVEELKAWLKENPVTVIYILATPIETDIPEETMTAYRNLCTNYPSTVIQNDSGAGMEVEYVADTKSYIDNKLKELIQAAYGNMANMLSLMPTNVQAEMIENDTNNILNNL